MPNYGPAVIAPAFSGNYGNRVVYTGSAVVSANLANGDKVRLCEVPAGTLVDRVVISNPDLDGGTTLTTKAGFEPKDGSVVANADVAVHAAGATTWRAAAVTTYEIFPPYRVTKDSWLTVQTGAAGTGTGTVHGKVEGENLGPK